MDFGNIMDVITGIGGSVASGGLTGVFGIGFGVLGAWLKGREERKKLEFQAAEQEKDRQHRLAVMQFEADNGARIEGMKTDREISLADIDSLVASVKADQATYLTGWSERVNGLTANVIAVAMAFVDVIRGLTRPAITAYLTYMVSRMWTDSMAELAGRLADAQRQEIALTIASTVSNQVLFLAGVAIGWWFGSRGQDKRAQRHAMA